MVDSQIKFSDVSQLIDQAPGYPITVARLLALAKKKKMDEAIKFFKLFPENMVFRDKEDAQARTEAVEIIHGQDAPPEDEIRGAED